MSLRSINLDSVNPTIDDNASISSDDELTEQHHRHKNKKRKRLDSISSSSSSSSDDEFSNDEPEKLSKKNPLLPLEIKRKILALALEIRALESQIPLLEETVDLQHERELLKLKHDIKLLSSRSKHLELDHERKQKIDEFEIATLEAQIPRIKELIERQRAVDFGKLDLSLEQLNNPNTKKRQRLATDLDVQALEAQAPYLSELVKLHKKTETARLTNDLRYEEYRSRRDRQVEEIETMQLKLINKSVEQRWKNWVERPPLYLKDPVNYDAVTGETELVISDRVVNINGTITYGTGCYVSDRINYYNNQDHEKPLFIVIDYCPGGSVMAGFRILQAIKESRAPIYLVVKTFAASMAAAIATLAERSFILPNAEILHHQVISSISQGNLTQAREWYEDLTQTWQRIAGPLAKKLGYTTEQWVKELYKNNSGADWCLYGDQAVKKGWIGSVVDRLRLTGNTINPDLYYHGVFCDDDSDDENLLTLKQRVPKSKAKSSNQFSYQDEDLNKLPKLRPRDYYWLYNPSNYYQT